MVVKIDSDLFEDDSYFPDLNRLLSLVTFDRYSGVVDNPNIEQTEWYLGARQSEKLFLRELLTKSINLKFDISLSTRNDLPSKVYSLKDGLVLLDNPVLVFLENSYNDERFLRSLLSCFKSKESKALRFLRNKWLQVRNCGGYGGVKPQVYSELRNFRKQELDNHIYLRALVLLDSDKKHPSDNDKDFSQVSELCTITELELHILEKREIENYLPLSILELDPDVDPNILNSLKRLTPEQLDHFDFDEGFNVNSKSKMSTKFGSLYDNLSDEDFKILRSGFRNTGFDTKKRIPSLFLKNELTEKMLLARCSHQKAPDELSLIVEKIEKLL